MTNRRDFLRITVLMLFCSLVWGCWKSKCENYEDNVIVFLGDSLTTGYTIPERSFPVLLQKALPEYKIKSLAENSATNGRRMGEGWPCILDQLDIGVELNPEYIVFWGGSNGIESQTEEEAIQDWKIIADRITDSCAKGIFLSLHWPDYSTYSPPLLIKEDLRDLRVEAEKKGKKLGHLIMENAIARARRNRESLNDFIQRYVEKDPKNNMLRTDKLLSPNHRFDPRFDVGDGMHLSEEACEVVAERLGLIIRSAEKTSMEIEALNEPGPASSF